MLGRECAKTAETIEIPFGIWNMDSSWPKKACI